MQSKYATNRKSYPLPYLRKEVIKFLVVGMEVKVEDVAKLLNISRKQVYSILNEEYGNS